MRGGIGNDMRYKYKEYRLMRDLSEQENYGPSPLKTGDLVYEYLGCTYGCIGEGGEAVSRNPGKDPFEEVPEDAIELTGNQLEEVRS